MKQYTFSSIIPLIGGMTLAAERVLKIKPTYIASWGSVFNNNDKYCLEYYKSDSIPYIELDGLKDYTQLKHVDLITALPPCAGLSMGNSSKSRGCGAASNQHMINAAELSMKFIHPLAIIVENAPNLYSKAGKEFADKINALANSYNYSMSLIKTSTIKHGLPQERTRSFFILWKGKKVPILEEISKPYKPYHEFMAREFVESQLVTSQQTKPSDDLMWQFIKTKYNQLTDSQILEKLASKKMVSVWETIYLNGWLAEATSSLATEPKLGKWLAYTLDKKSKGLNIMDASQKLAWHRTQALMWKTLPFLRHPHEDRWLMTSEALGLMGFPDDFSTKVSIPTSEANVICQNCPVSTAADWINEIIEALEGNRVWIDPNLEDDGVTRKILRQSNISKANPMIPVWRV